MAWTAPMTAVTNAVFTASQFNTHIRDNLLETAPAKAVLATSLFVTDGANTLDERRPEAAIVSASETTTSTSFTDLATTGPSVTVSTGTAALVFLSAQISNNTTGNISLMSYDVTGASTTAASDTFGIMLQAGGANQFVRAGHALIHSGLTEGSNIFTAKYRVTATTGTFVDRRINVVPL